MRSAKIIKSLLVLIAVHCLSCSSKSMPQPVEFTVASYNLHYFKAGYKGIRKTIAAIDVDVIALQEVLYRNKHDYSKQLARDLGYYHASSRPYQYMSKKASWLLSFLSKYPITGKRERKLGYYRKAFSVTMNIKGKKVTLTTTHLSPFVWSTKSLLAANMKRTRMRQRELRDMLTWTGKASGYAVILGDLNSIPLMGELSIMDDYGFRDVYDDIGIKNHGTFPLRPYLYNVARKYVPISREVIFDYIFISPACKGVKAWVHKSKASDHYPVMARISLKAGKSNKSSGKK